MTTKISFIGAGNMASALISGLLKDNFPATHITASDLLESRREALAVSGIHTTDNNHAAIDGASVVVLAVKPQAMKQVCESVMPAIQQQRPLIISIAAGIQEASLEKWLGGNLPIVRTMPNTPAMIQTGATVLHANAMVSDTQKDQAESLLRAVGITRWLDSEALIDAATAISGSGPAYYFLFMEAIEQTAVKLGLPADTAHLLSLQTALGAARMAIESQDTPEQLRKKVTSPGGTTEAAIQHMQTAGLVETLEQALTLARDRALELSAIMDETAD